MTQTSAELPCNLTSALPGDKVSVDDDGNNDYDDYDDCDYYDDYDDCDDDDYYDWDDYDNFWS